MFVLLMVWLLYYLFIYHSLFIVFNWVWVWVCANIFSSICSMCMRVCVVVFVIKLSMVVWTSMMDNGFVCNWQMILSSYGDKCLSIYFGNDACYHTCELLLGAIHAFILVPQSTTSTNGYRNNFRMFLYVYICINTLYLHIPENILAIAAIKKLSITPGPAIDLATMPATKYMPVPQHEPTPNDVRSNVVRHFCWN